ncbi:MAG: GNAT family N-acetyltransferase, partial [Caulobacterales bacterium]|nr:GNAT family N-acetyltransferase [Caulobacterales bacterium]
ALEAVEAWFAGLGLPTKFYTVDWATQQVYLPAFLSARCFWTHSETLVMTGPVGGANAGVTVLTEPDARFQAVMFEALYRDQADADERLATLRRIPQPMFFARIDVDGEPAAIGACAVDSGWGGISVMRTSPKHRRQGLAGRIVSALLGAVEKAGATRSYLQVEAYNFNAVALYEKSGFGEVYRYRYWGR